MRKHAADAMLAGRRPKWRPDRESGARSAAISTGGANLRAGMLGRRRADRDVAREPPRPHSLAQKAAATERRPNVESRWAAQEIGAAESRGSESGRIRVPLRREPAVELAFPGPCGNQPASGRAPTCRVGQRLPGSQFFLPNQLIYIVKLDCGLFGAKSSDNYATSSRKRGLNPTFCRKFIVSKFREAMLGQVSGRFPVAKIADICRGKAPRSKGQTGRGADRFQFHSALGRGAEVENEKKTNAHHV